MKKLLWITAAVLMAILVLTVILSEQGATPEVTAADQTANTAATGYTVRELNGRIAVFRDGELFMSTQTLVSELPKADRGKLQTGITVYSDGELKKLLEDLCS